MTQPAPTGQRGLLDTSVFIAQEGDRPLGPLPEAAAISVITLAELHLGVLMADDLKIRAQRAKLLGYPTHAHWRLEDSMAKTPSRAMELMEAVCKPAVTRVREEVADMQAIIDNDEATRLY